MPTHYTYTTEKKQQFLYNSIFSSHQVMGQTLMATSRSLNTLSIKNNTKLKHKDTNLILVSLII